MREDNQARACHDLTLKILVNSLRLGIDSDIAMYHSSGQLSHLFASSLVER